MLSASYLKMETEDLFLDFGLPYQGLGKRSRPLSISSLFLGGSGLFRLFFQEVTEGWVSLDLLKVLDRVEPPSEIVHLWVAVVLPRMVDFIVLGVQVVDEVGALRIVQQPQSGLGKPLRLLVCYVVGY